MKGFRIGDLVRINDNVYYGRDRKKRIKLGGRTAKVIRDWGIYVEVFFPYNEGVLIAEENGTIRRNLWILRRDLTKIEIE